MCLPMIYSDKGTYKNNMEFKKIKKNLRSKSWDVFTRKYKTQKSILFTIVIY